ncbi:MAG: hypothetical protein Q9N26_05935 [Aquificota bacterium]|nr:hypothetical protein [Aquificota bacterium]
MRYSKRLERLVLNLKGGGFFLSPRDREFLKLLEDQGIPEEVVEEGIKKCLTGINPSKRGKTPLFLCYRTVMETYENWRRIKAYGEMPDWRERFRKKLEAVKGFIRKVPPAPGTEEEARRVLREIEDRIMRNLWKKMPAEERRKIRRKYERYREERELYRELVKREIRKMFNLPDLSLYVD